MKHSRFTALILVAILLAFLVQGSALAGPKQDKGWLGVSIASISDDLASDHNLSVDKGVYVVDVFEKSPAMQAGVKPGDVIVAFEGDTVATTEDLTGALSAFGPGEKVKLTLVRGDKKLKLMVRLGERQVMPSLEKKELAEKLAKKEYAVKLKEHDKALKEHQLKLKKHEKMAKEHQLKAEQLIKQAMKEHKHELSEEEMAKLERALKDLDSQLYKLDEHMLKLDKLEALSHMEPLALKMHQGGAFLGVYPVTVTDALIDKVNLSVDKGVYITGVVDDGPAAKAGIMDGDVVVVIDGEKVADEEGLRKVLAARESGDMVVVVLVRGDDKQKVKVKLGGNENLARAYTLSVPDEDRLKAFAYAAPSEEHIKFYGGDWSMPQKMEQKGMLGVMIADAEDGEGVLVSGFTGDSAAKEAGMLEGDIIVNVNGHSTPDMKSLLKVMEDKKPGEEVKVKYQRDGKTRAVKFELGKSMNFFDAPALMNIYEGDEDAHKLFLKGLKEHDGDSPFIWHMATDDDENAPVMWHVSEDGDHASIAKSYVKVLSDGDEGEMKITIIGDDGEYKVLNLDELKKEGFKVKVDKDSDGNMVKKYVKMDKDGSKEQTVEICIVCPDGEDIKVITIDDDEDPDNYPKAKKKFTSGKTSAKAYAGAKSKSSSKSSGKSYARGGGGGSGWSSGGGSGGGDSTGKSWKSTWSDGSGGTKDGPWMGIMVDENSMDLAEDKGLTLNYGIYVSEVKQGSPADKAGLRAGDVIIQAGDFEPAGLKQFIETTRKVKAGDELYLKVVRGKNRVKLNVKRPG